MTQKKVGRPPTPDTLKIKRRNCTLSIEESLLNFVNEEIPSLNLSKTATDAIITQIISICNYKIDEAEMEDDQETILLWKGRLLRFSDYLHMRVQLLASKGLKSELEAKYFLSRYMLLMKGKPEEFAF